MRVAKIIIQNIMGIEYLEFDAGNFNVATAANGEGKTSFLQAIKLLVEGGEDVTILRRGAKTGTVALLLNDGTEISRRVTEKAVQPLVIRRGNGERVDKPASVMRAMADIMSVNPIEFIRARKKERVDVLLDSLPVAIDTERLTKIVGHSVTNVEGRQPFDILEDLRKSVFDERTGTNRALKEKRVTIEQLRATLPAGSEDGSTGDENEILSRIATIDAARDSELTRIESKLSTLRAESVQSQEGLRADCDADTAELRSRVSAREERFRDEMIAIKSNVSSIEALAAKQREKTLTRHAEQREALAADLARITAAVQHAARVRQTMETIRTLSKSADELTTDAGRQSESLVAIDAYKSELLSALPVDGLAVRDGEIFRHDIPFDRLNTAQQMSIAVEIAKLRVGELGIVCVDGLEMLDDANMAEFQRQVTAAGLQAFVTRVGNGEFELSAAA